MRRLVALFLAVSMLALPSAAAAQSAGDEQYADPFGQTEQPNGVAGAAGPRAAAGARSRRRRAAPAEQAVASQQTAAPTLPATGMPAHLLASMGALLLASGALLRRRVL